MEVPGADSDWRSPQFRQKVVAQIEDAMRKAGSGNTTHKSGTDMENHVFIKAKTREEYLSLVARLIIHFRDIHKKALGGADPMNALTNLTGVGGGMGMGPRPPGAAVGGMGAMGQMQLGQHAMAGVQGNPQAMGTPGQMSVQQMVQQQQQQQSMQFQQFQQAQQQQQQAQQNAALQQQQQQQQQFQQQQQQLRALQQHAQNQQLQAPSLTNGAAFQLLTHSNMVAPN
ncbi:mediator of RNA polymerase II transcription subunit 15-like [Xiphophorus hellerii]|uniref:mediator of RNA polymerase II transcription subunit 15-like n=1 Tax=Xiphophorus hellerii TaxID=8084 RepID=UPI0013B3A441|nr:mediator of RNA polymerase II transcription subunit 15-like [Xiphophorus hellerii]